MNTSLLGENSTIWVLQTPAWYEMSSSSLLLLTPCANESLPCRVRGDGVRPPAPWALTHRADPSATVQPGDKPRAWDPPTRWWGRGTGASGKRLAAIIGHRGDCEGVSKGDVSPGRARRALGTARRAFVWALLPGG